MRRLLSREYIPFGSQYYRAPSPPPSEWEGDLRAMAGQGFNTVKFWVQWRWNNPAEGVFTFDDIDRLMELAEANGLRVMLNTIVDVAPAWIYRKHADASMITLDGRTIGPQVQPHRQIGGLGLCFNHGPAVEAMMEFVRATVRRYAAHPALEMWNVASEPELTSSMAEMRLYADDAGRMGDMLCYCPRCRDAFRQWLAAKYASIDRLNVAWNRNYASFEEVELPLTRNSFNDVIDWRMFFVHTLGRNVRRRFEVAREEDGGRHPLMCHHVFIQGFPVTSTANDPWNVGKYGDLHAITQMDDPTMCDVLRSCAKGKPVISAEMLMLYGYTLDLPKPISLNDVKRYVFNGVAANLKGFIFWQYRPETLAREAPAWGLTHLDGSSTAHLEAFAEVNRVLQKNAAFLLDASPRRAEVALLYNPENQVFGWAATGSEKSVTDSLLGAHAALYRRNHVIDFIHAGECREEILSRYRVIYLPFPYLLSEAIAGALAAWVREGGVLLSEAYCAGWNLEHGRHQTTVPGYGLHRIFKARQISAGPGDEQGQVTMEVLGDLASIEKGEKVQGALVRESLLPDGAEVIAKFSDGSAAVTVAAEGKGFAILAGTYLGMPFHRGTSPSAGTLIADLVDLAVEIPRPQVTGPWMIRADLLTAPDMREMLIVRNLEPTSVRARVTFPGLAARTMVEQFSGEPLVMDWASGGRSAMLELHAGEVKVYGA
jgi:beta-galactosidase